MRNVASDQVCACCGADSSHRRHVDVSSTLTVSYPVCEPCDKMNPTDIIVAASKRRRDITA